MAKDKERSINPAQQARKQEKTRALKKAKNEQQARRNEKLAKRNPERIQRQVDDLKALEESGEIKPREKAILADLERDLRAVKKARETLEENAPSFGNDRPRHDRTGTEHGSKDSGVLGKRGRDGQRRQKDSSHRDSGSGSETDESVRAIPMPRDTPPPIPREHRQNNQERYRQQELGPHSQAQPEGKNKVAAVEHKTTYSSAPQLRDLRREAISRFVPSVVKQKQDAVRGVGGGLLEPEEMDKMEAAGCYKQQEGKGAGSTEMAMGHSDWAEIEAADEMKRLAEEEARFQKELAATKDVDEEVEIQHLKDSQKKKGSRSQRPFHVQIEEVEDEDL